MNGFVDSVKKLAVNQLSSNNPIIRVGGTKGDVDAKFLGGVHGTIVNSRRKEDGGAGLGFMDAVKEAHTKKDGSANWGAIAGSTMTAGAAMRIASGGGVYRDSEGNTNIIGVPMI